MAQGPIAGAITFSTALDNSDLEKGLQDAEKKVEDLKKKLEGSESEKSAIEKQMDDASLAIDATKAKIQELNQELVNLDNVDPLDAQAWFSAQAQMDGVRQKLAECNTTLEQQVGEADKLYNEWERLEGQVTDYTAQLKSAEAEQSSLATQVGSVYYQAGVRVRESMGSAASGVSKLTSKIGTIAKRVLVFNVLSSALSALRSRLSDALMQNDRFSASWTALGATVQGFANGIATIVAPAIAQVVSAVSQSIMWLARLCDTVFHTTLVASISGARSAAEATWRETDASKDAAKQNAKNAEQRAKQQESYAKAQERYAEQQSKAAERQAKAEEKAAKRAADAAQKYPDALEDAAEKQAKAEEDMRERIAKAERKAAERQADAEEKAQERYAKAQESTAERQAKAEASAAERTAAAQEAYEKKVAKAEQRQAEAATKAEKKQQKQAEKLQKAQDKANRSLIGFDEITKLNEESTEDLTDAVDDYTSATEEIEPPKVYTVNPEDYYVDPSDYVIDPEDYAIDYEDYQIDPEDFFVDPEDYEFDPSEYMVDPQDYAVDPFEFDWTDFADAGVDAAMKPNWDAFDVGKIDEKVTAIMAILAGAKLAIGAILAFSGINIPLGIALMAIGALEMASIVAENWETLPQEVRDAITNALVISGIVLIVIGAILAFSGVNVPLGVGMMAAGFILEWTTVALNWESLSPEMQAAVDTLMLVLSGAFFVLGVILLIAAPDPAHKAIGIGLMVLGSAGMVAAIMLVWDSLTPEMQQALTDILVGIGSLMVVVGIVLLVAVPGHRALGVGLIISGASLLAGAIALNWDSLGDTVVPALQKALDAIGKLMIVIGVVLLIAVPGQRALGVGLIIFGIAAIEVSEILLDWENLGTTLVTHLTELCETVGKWCVVLGTILCLAAPTHIALGIGLIVAGIAMLTASEVIPEWDSMDNKLQLVFDKLIKTIAEFMIFLGVLFVITMVNVPLGIGLIIGGIGILAVKEIAANWDAIKQKFEELFPTIIDVVAKFMIVLGIILCFAQQWPFAIGLIIGGIAILAIEKDLEPNWDSLKTQLETHLNDILVMTMGFLFIIGVVLCLVGNFPLGIGCIVAATIEGVTLAVINWDFIVDKCKEVWEKVKEWWKNGPAKIFTADWWFNLFKSIFNGLIDVLNSLGSIIGGWLDDLSYNLGQIVGASGGTYTAPAVVVPHISPLAEGAVIPANRKFLALMGDQRHGTNLETPEALMRQVVREEAANVMADMMLSIQAMQPTYQQEGEVRLILRVGEEDLAEAVHRGDTSLLRRGLISPSVSFA